MAPAGDSATHVELPRGLRLRVLRSAPSGEEWAIDAVVRRIEADRVALGVLDLPDQPEQLRGVSVMLAAQIHGRAYALDATVLDLEAVPPALIVSLPTEARRAERRRFYRLNRVIDVRGSWQQPAVEPDGAPTVHPLSETRLLDISGGGTLLRTREWVEPGALIHLEIPLESDAARISVSARARRVSREQRGRAYRINTEFEGISRRTQEQIIRFIFRQQTLLGRRRSQ